MSTRIEWYATYNGGAGFELLHGPACVLGHRDPGPPGPPVAGAVGDDECDDGCYVPEGTSVMVIAGDELGVAVLDPTSSANLREIADELVERSA